MKVGDKVKIKLGAPFWRNSENYSTIIIALYKDVKTEKYDYLVDFQPLSGFSPVYKCPYYERELEPLIKIGQQLEFSFMSEKE